MLEVRALSHRIGARMVLRQIGFSLRAGQALAILGPNGAGKTTLLRLLCGILPVQQGEIHFGGLSPGVVARHSDWRRQVGLLTETPGLYDLLSVRQNLTLFAQLYGMAPVLAARRVAAEALAFGFEDRLDQAAGQLSKGWRQRVALARAVLHEPSLLLLDEPTSGLDPGAAEALRERVRTWRAQGRTLVFTTHDLREADALADQAIVLRQGMVALPWPSSGDSLAAYRSAIATLEAEVAAEPAP